MGMITRLIRYNILSKIPVIGRSLNTGVDLANNYLSKAARDAMKAKKEQNIEAKAQEKTEKEKKRAQEDGPVQIKENKAPVIELMKKQMGVGIKPAINVAPVPVQNFNESKHFQDK